MQKLREEDPDLDFSIVRNVAPSRSSVRRDPSLVARWMWRASSLLLFVSMAFMWLRAAYWHALPWYCFFCVNRPSSWSFMGLLGAVPYVSAAVGTAASWQLQSGNVSLRAKAREHINLERFAGVGLIFALLLPRIPLGACGARSCHVDKTTPGIHPTSPETCGWDIELWHHGPARETQSPITH